MERRGQEDPGKPPDYHLHDRTDSITPPGTMELPRDRGWKVMATLHDPASTTRTQRELWEEEVGTENQDALWSEEVDDFIRNLDMEPMTEAQITRQRAINIIDSHRADSILYTDGSCSGGTEEGGAAVVITSGPAANPTVTETLRRKGGQFTCS